MVDSPKGQVSLVTTGGRVKNLLKKIRIVKGPFVKTEADTSNQTVPSDKEKSNNRKNRTTVLVSEFLFSYR